MLVDSLQCTDNEYMHHMKVIIGEYLQSHALSTCHFIQGAFTTSAAMQCIAATWQWCMKTAESMHLQTRNGLRFRVAGLELAVSILPSVAKALLDLYLPLAEPNWLNWSGDKDDMLRLVSRHCHVTLNTNSHLKTLTLFQNLTQNVNPVRFSKFFKNIHKKHSHQKCHLY